MLTINLEPGSVLLLDGAEMSFNRRVNVHFHTRVRFLAGAWVMHPSEAVTPEAQLYLAIQIAYVGPPADRQAAWDRAQDLARQIDNPAAQDMIELAADGKFHAALKIGRSERMLDNFRHRKIKTRLDT